MSKRGHGQFDKEPKSFFGEPEEAMPHEDSSEPEILQPVVEPKKVMVLPKPFSLSPPSAKSEKSHLLTPKRMPKPTRKGRFGKIRDKGIDFLKD